MFSRIVRAFAAVASVVLLAGCTSLFAPDPTAAPTLTAAPQHTFASVTCNPSTTRFAWTPSDVVTSWEAVSTRLQRFDKKMTGGSSDVPDPDYSLDADQAALTQSALALGAVLGDLDAWTPVLVGSLRTSTLAPEDLGNVGAIVDSTPFDPPKPHTGTWVRVVVAKTESYRFTMTCQDGTMASGRFGGVIPSTATEVTLHCDNKKHPEDSARLAHVRGQCTSL